MDDLDKSQEEFKTSGIAQLQSSPLTVFRQDCRCGCHRDPDISHLMACCFDLKPCATDADENPAS